MVIAVDRNTGAGSGSMFSAAEQTGFYAGFSGECDYESSCSVFGLLVSISNAFYSTLDYHAGICSLDVRGVHLSEMSDGATESVLVFFDIEWGFLFRRYGL